MHSRITSCLRSHDGRRVPRTLVAEVADCGQPALTMRYGSDTVREYGEKAHEDYTLTARKVDTDETFYHGLVTTPETATDIAFIFDEIGATGEEDDTLDDVFVDFIHALTDATNTEDAHWFVDPQTRPLTTALADYPYYIQPDACEREIALHAPDDDITFTRPSNLTLRDLRFVALTEDLSPGDVLLETDAPPDAVRADTWFDHACTGVGEDVTLALRPRDDGGTQFVVTSCSATEGTAAAADD